MCLAPRWICWMHEKAGRKWFNFSHFNKSVLSKDFFLSPAQYLRKWVVEDDDVARLFLGHVYRTMAQLQFQHFFYTNVKFTKDESSQSAQIPFNDGRDNAESWEVCRKIIHFSAPRKARNKPCSLRYEFDLFHESLF